MSRPRWYYESDGGLGDWTGTSFTSGPKTHYLICEDTGERIDYPSKRVAMKALAVLIKEPDMANPNQNILSGMSCPKCGSPGPFEIAALVVVSVSDDESEVKPQDHEWHDDSPAKCLEPECEFTGKVLNFSEEGRTV